MTAAKCESGVLLTALDRFTERNSVAPCQIHSPGIYRASRRSFIAPRFSTAGATGAGAVGAGRDAGDAGASAGATGALVAGFMGGHCRLYSLSALGAALSWCAARAGAGVDGAGGWLASRAEAAARAAG